MIVEMGSTLAGILLSPSGTIRIRGERELRGERYGR
jgi:hypothetical protein